MEPSFEYIEKFMKDEYTDIINYYEVNNFRFELKERNKCNDDRELMKFIGFYVFKLFQTKNLQRLKPINFFTKLKGDNLFLVDMKIKQDENFSILDDSYDSFGIFLKEFSKLKNKDDYHKIYREYMVGILLNMIRHLIPNLVFTFPLFIEKEMFYIIENKNNNEFNEFGESYVEVGEVPNLIILMESVKGETLYDFFIKFNEGKIDVTYLELYSIYLQIILALNAINQRYYFSHNDLHFGNIMVQKLNYYKILTYTVITSGEKKRIKLKTNILIKIIDFGLSSIKFKHYDINKREYTYPVSSYLSGYDFPEFPFPEGDIAKVTARFYDFFPDNNIFYGVLRNITLNKEEYNNVINDRYHYMQHSGWNKKITYDIILKYILDQTKSYFENIIFNPRDLKIEYKNCIYMLIHTYEKMNIHDNFGAHIMDKYELSNEILKTYINKYYDGLIYIKDYILSRIGYSYIYSKKLDIVMDAINTLPTYKYENENIYLIISKIIYISLIKIYLYDPENVIIKYTFGEFLLLLIRYNEHGTYFNIDEYKENIRQRTEYYSNYTNNKYMLEDIFNQFTK
uniref:Protein kinase n=1 Tax=Pithovirus LCDPAC02 TaxID=2506601 RepID=A0A481YRQ8_9VIRU|nr:MAG: protein kinase [Pithovirus LCDPAC02]